jgi:lipopolysaccharide biosynthesis regulator YciM
MARAAQLAQDGKRQEALKEMDADALKYASLAPMVAAAAAEVYAALGDKPDALDWLERAVRTGHERVEWFRRDPLLAKIRNEPRSQQIPDSTVYGRQQRRPP